jgi:hypothetical protein
MFCLRMTFAIVFHDADNPLPQRTFLNGWSARDSLQPRDPSVTAGRPWPSRLETLRGFCWASISSGWRRIDLLARSRARFWPPLPSRWIARTFIVDGLSSRPITRLFNVFQMQGWSRTLSPRLPMSMRIASPTPPMSRSIALRTRFNSVSFGTARRRAFTSHAFETEGSDRIANSILDQMSEPFVARLDPQKAGRDDYGREPLA